MSTPDNQSSASIKAANEAKPTLVQEVEAYEPELVSFIREHALAFIAAAFVIGYFV